VKKSRVASKKYFNYQPICPYPPNEIFKGEKLIDLDFESDISRKGALPNVNPLNGRGRRGRYGGRRMLRNEVLQGIIQGDFVVRFTGQERFHPKRFEPFLKCQRADRASGGNRTDTVAEDPAHFPRESDRW
jgi:hypothetical protein